MGLNNTKTGNTNPAVASNSNGKEEMSPHVLSQTSVDDKAWLAVSEESLMNDNFMREKYFLLDSRLVELEVNDIWESQRQAEVILYHSILIQIQNMLIFFVCI
jgi:hypothetical protein